VRHSFFHQRRRFTHKSPGRSSFHWILLFYSQADDEVKWLCLSHFRHRGGKIITYHGWTDQLIFPRGSIDSFDRVVVANGGLERVRDFDRLFMVSGMNHCAGGAGAVNFGQSGVVPVSLDPEHDAILALQRWVEEGVAPKAFIATTDPQPRHAAENPTNPATFTRLLCPFSETGRYKGSGDPNSAANFVCVGDERERHHGDNDDRD